MSTRIGYALIIICLLMLFFGATFRNANLKAALAETEADLIETRLALGELERQPIVRRSEDGTVIYHLGEYRLRVDIVPVEEWDHE